MVEYNKFKKNVSICFVSKGTFVCTVNSVHVSISFAKERDCHGKHADDVMRSIRLLGDYYDSMSEIFSIFI